MKQGALRFFKVSCFLLYNRDDFLSSQLPVMHFSVCLCTYLSICIHLPSTHSLKKCVLRDTEHKLMATKWERGLGEE